MKTLATGLSYFDLEYLGTPRIIATGIVHGAAGVSIIDPGPSTTLPALRAGLARSGMSLADVRSILLTHIHLDHAGATGVILREHPSIRVHVHQNGAAHLVDPSKLLASATRLWGADMDRLWGEVAPVPASALTVLAGGERISAGGRDLDVAYTPGHASHHVSYFSADAGIAFVGDTAGVRLFPGGFNMPPTPPPDIDLDAWRESLAIIARWQPSTVFLTHFGPFAPVGAHLTEVADHLALTSRLVKESLALEGDDESREAWFTEQIRLELGRRMSGGDAFAYEVAGRFDLSWRGLARYWRRKTQA
jgi:glyoxylase-like metal-dependent hydrolase (beta-lactamase superfamily II)